MPSVLYSLAVYLLSPLFFCYLLIRGWRDRDYWHGWGQRLGFYGGETRSQGNPQRSTQRSSQGIVVHAVSVGEINAAEALIRALSERYPDLPLTITCFTPTGSRRVMALFGSSVAHHYWPLDLPGAVRRFFRHCQPRLVIVLETEIWPNFYARAEQLGIPLMLVNARISDGTFKRYQRFQRLSAAALATVDRIGAQSVKDQQRLLTLGAPPAVTHMTGNLKYDLRLDEALPAQGLALRQSWGADRPVWLAASTREGEEALILTAFKAVKKECPEALLVLVPRHPERFDEVAGLVQSSQLSLARHSQARSDLTDVSCYLVDVMGELLRFYAACDLAFVGGSLANTGGHNALEAAAQGRPVLVGPHTFNFAQITEALVQSGGALRVLDADSLQRAVLQLLADPGRRQVMGRAGRDLVAAGQGALERTLDMVAELLGNP